MTGSRLGVLAVMDGRRLTGPARQLLALARADRWANAQITLGIFQRPSAPTPLVGAVRALNIPMVVVRDRFPGDPRTMLALRSLAGRPATKILQTHGYKANVLAAFVAAKARRPWVAFLHGETWENRKVRVYFALEQWAVRHADRIVVVSRDMARKAILNGVPTAKIRVVHNACLIEHPSNDDVAAWRSDAPAVIGVVGRLSPEKGVDIALRVHRLVTQRRKDARLWIVGEGPAEATLKARAAELGIVSSVEWLGYREDPSDLYRQMTVLLIPSRSEGLPNVALEAMAHGIPVVASAVGGVPEVVSDGATGFLASAEDAGRLAAAVVQLLQDAALRRQFGQQARKDVTSLFSLDARLRALAGIYEEMTEHCA